MRGENRKKILAGWKAQYAAALAAHKTATAAGEKETAGRHVRTMKALERAIRAYGEEKKGELRASTARRNRAAAADRGETFS